MRLVCAALIGCLCTGAAGRAQTRRTVHVDESYNGRRVDLHVGDLLEVGLAENSSTGYQWAVPRDSAELHSLLRLKEESREGPSAPPGAAGMRHLIFEAIAPGKADLELHYKRPWESSAGPAKRFKIQIRVRN